jgi:hypothetical protein
VKFAKLIRVVGVLLQKFTCFGLAPIDYVASFFLFCAKKPFFEPLSDASINFVNISYFVAARSSRLGFLRLLFRSTKTASSLVDEACFSPVKWLG